MKAWPILLSAGIGAIIVRGANGAGTTTSRGGHGGGGGGSSYAESSAIRVRYHPDVWKGNGQVTISSAP
jgi:hypothetical protein